MLILLILPAFSYLRKYTKLKSIRPLLEDQNLLDLNKKKLFVNYYAQKKFERLKKKRNDYKNQSMTLRTHHRVSNDPMLVII